MDIKNASKRQGLRVAQAREKGSSGNLKIANSPIEHQDRVAQAISELNNEYVPYQKLPEIPAQRTFSGTVGDILNAAGEGAYTAGSGIFNWAYTNVLNPTNPNQERLQRLGKHLPYYEKGEWVQTGTPEHSRGRLEQETQNVMDNFAHVNNLNNVRKNLGVDALGDIIKDNYSPVYKQTEKKKAEELSKISSNDMVGQLGATLTFAGNHPIHTLTNATRDLTASATIFGLTGGNPVLASGLMATSNMGNSSQDFYEAMGRMPTEDEQAILNSGAALSTVLDMVAIGAIPKLTGVRTADNVLNDVITGTRTKSKAVNELLKPSNLGKATTTVALDNIFELGASTAEGVSQNIAQKKDITHNMGAIWGDTLASTTAMNIGTGSASVINAHLSDGYNTVKDKINNNKADPNSKKYDPVGVLNNALAGIQSTDVNKKQQAKEGINRVFNTAHSHFNSLVSQMNNETNETKKQELKRKVVDHYNKHISPLHSAYQAYSKVEDVNVNLGEIFVRKQEINARKLADIEALSQEYSPYLSNVNSNSPSGNGNTTNAVIRMGKYKFQGKQQINSDDVGRGSGDHIDLHVVGGGNPTQYTDRFVLAEGKFKGLSLKDLLDSGKYTPSEAQRYGAARTSKKGKYSHAGIDFDSRINGGVVINPNYAIKDVTKHHNPHGYGHYIQVHFADGVSIGLGHLGKESVDAFFNAYGNGKGSGNANQASNVNASWTGRKHRDIGTSDKYDGLMQEVYTKYGFTAEEQKILKAQIGQESNFDIKAKSSSKAFGLTQFIPATASKYGVREGDAKSQIEGQAKYMKDLLNRYNGDWAKALAAYNTGEGNVDKHWGSDGTGKGGGVMTTKWNSGTGETLKYVENILHHAGVTNVSGGTSIDSDSTIEQLQQLLNQWEQEEVNATNEEDKANLQGQIEALTAKLDAITNTEQEEQATEQEARQAFAVEFNPNLSQEEIDNNPFLSDKEKEEYKQTLEIVQEIEGSKSQEYQPKSPEVVQRTYDDIEEEFQAEQANQTNQNKQSDDEIQPATNTGLIDNEPIFTQRFSLSSTTPEEIDSNPNLTSNQKRAIHKMMDVQRQIADTRDVQDVTNDIIVGSVGNTILESNRGLQDYITGFENAINANNIKAASDLLTDLQYLRDTRISKNNAINQALQLVEDNNIKDINDAPIIAQDADTKEWFITEYTGLREGYPEFDGSNALTIFKPNKLTERLDKEAKLVDDFTNAWADYLSDYNIEGIQAPTLDNSMATVTSKTANRTTRSYDEAEATFKGKEFTQERVKSELPPLTETNKNTVDVKAGKIQLVQDINQVPEDGVFLGRSTYKDVSGKSRPSSMYDMEKGRINIGDAGWLASPYNPPRQGYKPSPFTLADSKPSTHAEAYGNYFKRMFMQDDGFANAVLELEPSKLYRTKYSTTEAQFIGSFLQNVPKESVEDARAWVTDKVYGIENGKPSFKVSNKDDVKSKTKSQNEVKKETKTETKKETKTKNSKNTVDESTYVDTSEELTTLKLDKDTLASVKAQLTGKPIKIESNDTKAKNTSIEANTKKTNTDSNEVAGKSNKPSLTGFKKESTTVNLVFNNTPEQVEQEKSKHWQSQNHLILGFKQEANKPLVNILDLASNLENDLTTGIEELLPNIKATEAQIKQVKHFLDFNKAFVNSLKNSYHKEAIAADGRDYSFRDFKGYLQKEDGSFDENILTALSLSAYSHFIVNNKDINSYKDIGKLLNYPEDITIPSELLSKYKYVGDRYNNTVNSIGRTAYDLLGLKTNKDVSELYKGRMIASLGNWVVSSMVNEGLMYEATISNAELKKDSYDLDNINDDETTDDHSIVTLLSFTRPDGEGKKTLLDDIAEINKGTQGFLGKLFGGDVGLRSPTLKPTERINRDIRGTTAKVSDTQAKLQKHMQQEPIVINNDSFNGLHKLVEKFPEQAKTMIGAYISKDTLDSMHESKRVGAEAQAEGNNRELERLIGFTSGLKKDEEGNYQEFFDSNYVTKNNRGQYNSNEVNMQTMKIHRAMVDYKNFKQVIEADVLNNITGTETDFVVDGELTDLGHLFSAIAENAEGTEDVIKDMLNNLTYRRGFTVDKVRAEDFLPAFFEHLETDEAIQTAVTSTQKLLEGKEINQSDMDNIQSVVDAWKMQALSFRALIEYAKFKQAQKDNTDLITSFGLGADGVNNGSAISYTLMGLMINKENPDLMNQIGVFTEESGFSTFHETRLKGLNDYYEGLGTIMEKELSNYKPDLTLKVNLFYRINPSIEGRKGAKEVLIPAGYGAGVKRLLEVAFESLIRDITDSYESLHNKNKNLETNKGSMSEAEYNKEMGAIVDDYNSLQNDLRVALNDRGFNLAHPSEMLESNAFLSKQQQKKLKEAYNDVIGTLIINSFNKYSKSFNEARKANIRFHEASASMYLTLHNTQLNKALEAKKEKIKESLNTIHKELVQNRLDSANAKHIKNKEPLTYEDILETMAKDQLEFEGLTKQEYKEQVEKPLLKVFPTLNTAFNYAEPRHKRKLSDIRILKSKTTTVDVSDSYQMKTKGADGKVKYKKASILTQEWVSAGVAPNSAQVQGVDARVAFEAAAMNGNVSLNVHDNVIAGRRNYVSMVRTLNKKFYETTRDYHANLASVIAFIDTLDGLVSIKDDIDEKVFNKTIIDSLINFLNFNSKEKEAYLDATDGDINEIVSDVRPQVIHEIGMAINRDILKIEHYEKVSRVHQYAGYGGQYELTAEDKAKEKEELAKLEKIQETVKERVTKLLAEISEISTDTLTTKPDEPRKQGFKDLEIEQQEQSLLKPYGLNQLQKSAHKLRDGSAEFKLFDYLSSLFDKNKDIKVVFTDNLPNTFVEGMYDNKTNTIYFRESLFKDTTTSKDKKIRLINHELLHALTETGIRVGKEKGSKAYKNMQKMYGQIKQKANGQYAKELADMNEFIAYGLTDAKFRAFIADNLDTKSLGVKTSKIQSALDTFLKAVYSILGFNTSHNFKVFAKTVDALIIPYKPIQGTGILRHSASAMKSNKANIERGMKAMNQVITTKADKKRAMYRNDIGWIDFVWGSTGVLKANGKTKGAMGISHIIEARMRKDGLSYQDAVRFLTNNIVNTIALGSQKSSQVKNNTHKLSVIYGDTVVHLIKTIGSNGWMITGYEFHDKDVPNGGDRVGGDTSNPTHITPTRTRDNVGAFGTLFEGGTGKGNGKASPTHNQSYSARTDVGASNGNQMMNQSRGATTSDLRTSSPILSRTTVGASDKNSIAPKDIPFKQRYSQSDVTSDMSTVEVIQSLDSSMIDSEHNQRLDDLTQRIIGTFGMNSNQGIIVDNDKILQSDALVNGFKMSDKEIAVYNSLHAVFTTMENHKANQNYQSLVKLYSDAKKQLSYRDFLTTDRPTSEDVLEAKRKYDYVFNSEEHLNDRIAVFASLGLANEEMVKVLQKPRQVKQRETESLFDKLMTIFDKVFKALTEKALFKGGKDFQSQLNVLSDKLVKVDADVRANKKGLHEIAWQGVSLVTTPLNKAVHLGMGLAVKQASKLEGSSNPDLDNIGKIFGKYAKIKDADSQAEMVNIIKMINASSSRGRFNEVRELVNEANGIVGDTSKVIMDKVLRLTQNIGRGREKHRKAVIKNIKSYFPNKGKDLTVDETSSVTRVLLRTDVSSLLNDNNQDAVLKLIIDDKYRQNAIEELHSLVSSFNLSKSKTNGIIMSAMDLAAYLAKEEVPNNLYKNPEGIARFYGQEGNTKLIEIIDKLATLQALEYTDKKDLNTAKHMMKSYPDAMWNVLKLHKAYTTISKEQEFKYNKYSYQKGYLPQDTNKLRSLVHAESMDEVLKLQEEGWELLTQSPDGMKQDNADLTKPRYLMFHKNSNYRDYNSGALDMKDTHTKGSVIYTYRDHKDITRYIKDKDALMAKRNTTVNPKNYSPFEDTGNMVMAYDPYGAIINVHYEMRGATRDKYLERNNNFIDLMGLYVSGIDAKPMLMEQQADVAKVLYQDYKLNYKQRPYEFIVLDPRSKDEKTLETLRMMPYSFRAEAERLFGKGEPIIVKKSVFLMTFGYRQLSIGDLFDKHFDDLGAFSKAFVIGSKAILGKKAKGRIMMAEYFVSRLTSLFADFTVIRNLDVLKGNIISNSLMLMLRGVNPVDVVKESIRVWKQGRDYAELENELNDLRVKYQTVKDKTQIEKQMKDIYARMEKHPLNVYFKQGLMSSIVEGVETRDNATYGSIWEEELDKAIDTYVPKKVKDAVDFFMMNKGSPLHNMMTHATQFSDFSAKIILIEHLKKQGMSEKQAIAEAQDTFINFDIPTGAKMDYANRMGLFMFTKFFVRFQKAMIRALGKTPASTLLQHTLVEQFTNEAGILDPFVLNRLGNNPFDLAPLSLPSTVDDILTMKIVDAMIPDIF